MPFDRPEHAIGYGQNNVEFNKDGTCKLTAMTLKPANPSTLPGVVVHLSFLGRAFVHRSNPAQTKISFSNSLA